MPFFYAFSIRQKRGGAAHAKALRGTALVVAAFFQYHSDDLPLDEGQRLGEVERGGGGGRRIRVGGRKGKLRLQGGLNVRQPDLCIRAQFRQPFHHAVELQIVLRPRRDLRSSVSASASMPRHCLPVSIVWRSRYRLNAVSTCAGWACRGRKGRGESKTGG